MENLSTLLLQCSFSLFLASITSIALLGCGGGKKKGNDDCPKPPGVGTSGTPGEGGSEKEKLKSNKEEVAGTHDPNYQTMAGVKGDCFGADMKKDGAPAADAPKAPAGGGMAGTHDPNYQTMAGVGGDCFGADKKKDGAAAGGPKAPAAGGMAGTHDPNYQTLAGVGGECFGADKKAAAGPKAPAAGGMAGTHDPNYQTLAGVKGDCFEKKK